MTGIGEISYLTNLIERRLNSGLPGQQAIELFQYYEALSATDKVRFVADLIQILVVERHLRKVARRRVFSSPAREDAV